jgi:hypothetical protein
MFHIPSTYWTWRMFWSCCELDGEEKSSLPLTNAELRERQQHAPVISATISVSALLCQLSHDEPVESKGEI